MPGRFQPGDHLHVFRRVAGLPAGYYHHGILISAAILMTISALNRRNVPVPGWLQAFAVGSTIAGLAARSSYNHGIKKLWDEIRDDWFAFERMTEDDPRNETS